MQFITLLTVYASYMVIFLATPVYVVYFKILLKIIIEQCFQIECQGRGEFVLANQMLLIYYLDEQSKAVKLDQLSNIQPTTLKKQS